jgi:hypothetical protein
MSTASQDGAGTVDVPAGSCRIDDCWLVTAEATGRRRETVAEEGRSR